MRKILIISPHYPPSNLTSVHRTRLFAQHLPAFGWEPIILTVSEKYYEEGLDWSLHQLLPTNQKIEKVRAFKILKPRMVGDLGLRAFFQLRRRALQLVKSEKVVFVYIPIPSFYISLIGRYLHKKTGIKYGIDYIDPWVHRFPGSEKIFSRHWFSTQLAKILEPIAIKEAAVITGVSEGYFQPTLERNSHYLYQVNTAAMPYGGEGMDHDFIRNKLSENERRLRVLLPDKNERSFCFVYAGAMLSKAYKPLEKIFEALSEKVKYGFVQDVQFHFIGTLGTIQPLAEKFGLWQSVIFEHPDRISYIDVLINLEYADGIFILGSTEPHYTPSKVYQAVLSKKPILAVLHHESSAVNFIRNSHSGKCALMNGEHDLDTLGDRFMHELKEYFYWIKKFDPQTIDKKIFDQYSAKEITRTLAQTIEKCLV